jgi:modulator of FtsH protease
MSIREWTDFFVAAAGAGAALAGLIIVAMSVNIQKILAIPGMTSRAATTIASLVLIVIVSCAGLMPFQPLTAFGLEAAASAVLALVLAVRSSKAILQAAAPGGTVAAALRSLLGVLPTVLVFAGSLLACFGLSSGVAVIAAGILVCVAASSTNAWVLLVEILR